MPSLASLTDPKVYHLLTYSALFGSNFYQTFINGPFSYKALTRPQFSTLQTVLLPIYFGIQSVLPLLLAATWPGDAVTAFGGSVQRRDAGFPGLLQGENLMHAFVPIAITFIRSVLNALVLGPATTKVMKARREQESKEGKKYYAQGPKSPEMAQLNKSFGQLHGISASVDLIGFSALLYYGIVLAEKL